MRPTRLTAEGRKEYQEGNHPKALEAFERAARARPGDARARFNLADALYKNGRFDEAEAHYKALAGDAGSPLAAAAHYNMGNALFEKKDYAGAVGAYRRALGLQPADTDTQHNLELALRALREQQQKQEQQQQQQQQQQQDPQSQQDQQKQVPNPSGKPEDRPRSPQEQERARYEQETGMPKERAMQLLEALQQNEKAEQKKQRAAARQKNARKAKDW